MNKAVTDNLNYYLSLDKPEYAFMISGDWGVGKTYFVKEYIKYRASQNEKLIWVSLFGVNNLVEIDQAIFQSLHPILSSKAVKLTSNILKGALSFGFKVDIDGDGSSNESISFKPNGNGVLNTIFGVSSKEIIFVFDDLERTDIEKKEILGYINRLIEGSEVKVIIIANEEKLQDKSIEEDIYLEFKEKVIGKTFKVDHDFDIVLDSFLNHGKYKVLLQYKEEIKQVYQLSNYKNLRKVKQSISDFIYVYKSLDKKFLDSDDFISSLVKSFFSLSFEIKKGVLSESQLLSNKAFSKDGEIYKKYFSHYPSIYDGKMWASILFRGDLNLLDEHTSKLIMFYQLEAPEVKDNPTWLKLWNYRDVENEEFNELINTLISEVRDSHECKARDFLHKISILIFFKKSNLINVDLEIIESGVISYIDKYKEVDVWSGNEINLGSPHNDTGYQYLSFDDQDFIRIGGKISKINNQLNLDSKNNKNLEYKARLLDDLLSGDIDRIDTVLDSNHRSTPIFSDLSPSDFVERLKLMKNESIKKLGYTLLNRYLTHDSLNGIEYGDYLKSEVCFWKETKSILDESKSQDLKSFIINEFSEKIISEVILRLSEDK